MIKLYFYLYDRDVYILPVKYEFQETNIMLQGLFNKDFLYIIWIKIFFIYSVKTFKKNSQINFINLKVYQMKYNFEKFYIKLKNLKEFYRIS